jgi:hypothetical protein
MDDPWPRRLIGIVLALALAMVLPLVAMPASANGSSSTISDQAGDALKISPGNAPTPAYLDIIGVSVARHGSSFEFSVDLAAPVPSQPLLVDGVNQYAWFWFLNTDPTTFPSGYPRVPGFGTAPEFALWVAWDGVQFTASIVDRRPTLRGGDSVFTPVGFSLNAAHVSAFVDAGTIGDPGSFGFRAQTRAYQGLPGTEGFSDPDGAPNTAPGTPGYFVAWPS